MNHTGIFVLVCLILAVVLAGCFGNKEASVEKVAASSSERSSMPSTSAENETSRTLLREATEALHAKEYERAETAIRKKLVVDPDDVPTLFLAGKVAEGRGDLAGSLTFYQEAVQKLPAADSILLDNLTKDMIHVGRVFDAIELLKTYIERFPDSAETRFDIAGLATMVGVTESTVSRLQWLFQHNKGDVPALLLMVNPGRLEPDIEFCNRLMASSADDIRPRYAQAKLEALHLNWQNVRELLQPVIKQHPTFLPALVLFGRALVELEQTSELPAWHESLTTGVDESPEYWIVIARWAQAIGKPAIASQAFLNVQRINATCYPEQLQGLYRSLLAIGDDRGAQFVATQLQCHIRLRDAFKTYQINEGQKSQAHAFDIAKAMVELGRIWEAEAWARHAVALTSDRIDDIQDRYVEIRSKLQRDSPWILPENDIASAISLSPSLDFGELLDGVEIMQKKRPVGPVVKSNCPSFRDESNERGFNHTCELSTDAETKGHWLHQSSGGGIGVIDFDLDSQPDIAVTMLDGVPLADNCSRNRLFRNQAGKFVEVGEESGYIDTGFSQGIAVGDVNDDGFPDLVDANIGQNRLFINNGDGTFREVAREKGMVDVSWTISAAIADLDGDGNADVFDVNYCNGSEPFRQACLEGGRYSACSPLQFQAQQDRVWRGIGDGSLMDATSDWMPPTSWGRGLGIMVGRMDERPGLDVYVGNDMTANHFWSSNHDAETFGLLELASIRGLAVNRKSQSQASMGIAFADADSDGDFDLFLSHFAKEYNTLYEQTSHGFWMDRSFQSGLAQPSINMLGFGTEWCDFDNDGMLELIVTNGHIDEFRDTETPFRMQGQVFRRASSGKWEPCKSDQLGEYFQQDHVGRALVIVDIDCDGRNDVLVTHLYEPVAMLMNRTSQAGKSIYFFLKSTASQRDAIGAVVTATVGDREVVSMITAGGGYMCSNEKKVSFGIGTAEALTNVSVQWPSGRIQDFGDFHPGRSYLLVEGHEPFRYVN